jgi:hypothetical protein
MLDWHTNKFFQSYYQISKCSYQVDLIRSPDFSRAIIKKIVAAARLICFTYLISRE